jgi:hypothetical protein
VIPDGDPIAADLDARAARSPGEPDEVLAEGVRLRVLSRIAPGVGVCVVDIAPGAQTTHAPRVTEDLFILRGELVAPEPSPAGTFLRWQSGQARRISSPAGCRFILAARPALDDRSRHVQSIPWRPWGAGMQRADLVDDLDFRVVLLGFDPGVQVASHCHEGGEELFVVRGELEDEHGRYPAGSWVRQPAGSRHAVVSRPGCVLWTTSGHLAGTARQRLEATR